MKFCVKIFSVILIVFQLLLNNNLQAQSKLLVKSIEYDVPIVMVYPDNLQYEAYNDYWWESHIETSYRMPFLKTLINKAKNGTLDVYDKAGKLLTKNDVCRFINRCDTLTYQQTVPFFQRYDTVVLSELYPAEIQFIRFREQWYYDTATFKITKQISEYAPVSVEYDKNGKKTGKTTALFWIRCNKNGNDHFVSLTNLISYNINLFQDLKEPYFVKRLNVSDDSLKVRHYTDLLSNNAENGKVKIYNDYEVENFYGYDQDSIEPLSKNALNSKFLMIDTIGLIRPFEPYEEYDTIIFQHIENNNFKGITFYEKWLIDENSLALKKEILGISPVLLDYDYDGQLKGFKRLFHYSFEKPARLFFTK
jgi:hypothetical protein